LESQLTHKIVNLLFTNTKSNIQVGDTVSAINGKSMRNLTVLSA
jgi:hypothetical protein